MSLLNTITFVKGAVAKRDLVPALTHYLIRDRRIYGFNGVVSLSCPVDIDGSWAPNAQQFWRVLELCGDGAEFVPDGDRILIRGQSGEIKVSAYVERIDPDSVPIPAVTGSTCPIPPGFMDTLHLLRPFIGEDASRQQFQGIFFRKQVAWATNNVIAVEAWQGKHGKTFPMIVLPVEAIDELIRIKETPETMTNDVDAAMVTFHYSGGHTLTTRLLPYDRWPDFAQVFDEVDVSDVPSTPEHLFPALRQVKPFANDRLSIVTLSPGQIQAAHGDTNVRLKVPGLGAVVEQSFSLTQLLRIEGADKIGLDRPKRIPFITRRGKVVARGVLCSLAL